MRMTDRSTRIALWAIVALLAAWVAQPWLERALYSATTPRDVAPRAALTTAEITAAEVFKKVSPSVVHVFARTGAQRLAGQQASGSGFVWDAAGHVVTNNHVVQGAGEIAVRLQSGTIVPARLVGRAPDVDLAVVRVERLPATVPPIAIGTSGDLQVGQTAYAIGNPFGLEQTLTTGIVSALQRRLPTDTGRDLQDMIQTDAAINPGNSGGPLLDSAGRLIGVNTAIFSPSGASAGIGFAIPVDTVNRVIPELISKGRVPTPGIGIVAARIDTALQLGMDGVVILQTVRGSPAERAGLRGINTQTGELGDVIVAVEGERVTSVADLSRLLTKAGIGKPVRLTIMRSGREETLSITVQDVGP
jgi:2-alkenal reductase